MTDQLHSLQERLCATEQELARTEGQLRQAQKLEALGRLAGGVVHDINNTLTIVLGYANIALRKLAPTDPIRDLIEQMIRACEVSATVIDQLLCFSRKSSHAPAIVHLNQVVTKLQTMLSRLINEDVELVTSLDTTLGGIRVDQALIEQLILNLVVNALEAMPTGGRLTIQTSNVCVDEEGASQDLPQGEYVLLTVCDTGCGMSEETKARMFEPFFTTKQGKGTGLGLATVAGVVQQCEGRVSVDSAPDKGSRFHVYLPRVDEQASAQPSSTGSEPLRGNETILLVEDDSGVRLALRVILEELGYNVMDAANGAEALEDARRWNRPIHLLLTDAVMPQMNGLALAENLKSLQPDMKILFMSGHTEEAVLRRGLEIGAMAFLQKPFTDEELTRKIRALLLSKK